MAGELVFITGATGHVGFAVLVAALRAGYRIRASVRRSEQGQTLKNHHSVKQFVDEIEVVTVPDITAHGAFDHVLHGVAYIEHIASPIPKAESDDLERDIIQPAIAGTTSILTSALKYPSIRRIVITSSMAAITPLHALTSGDATTIYKSTSRVEPLPTGPWTDAGTAYRASKVLALAATDAFQREHNPHFSVVNIMPPYVVGANEFVTDAGLVAKGSNGVVMNVILGQKSPVARSCATAHVLDVARIHVEALDEEKVKGSQSFLLDSGPMLFDDANEIVRRAFPQEVEDGTLPLGGSIPAVFVKFDVEETRRTFGEMIGYEEQVKSVVSYYLSLMKK